MPTQEDLILVNNYQKATIETQKLTIESQARLIRQLGGDHNISTGIIGCLRSENRALRLILESQRKRIKVLEQIVGN